MGSGSDRIEGKSLGDVPRDKPLMSSRGKMFTGWIWMGHSLSHMGVNKKKSKDNHPFLASYHHHQFFSISYPPVDSHNSYLQALQDLDNNVPEA
jgi:hypothetical protein